MFIDFKELKDRVSIEDVAQMLDLELKQQGESNQRRGPCPRCDEEDERALALTPGKGYYCFAAKAGGDCIALAAHILDLPMKEAALRIAAHFDGEAQERTEEPQTEQRNAEPLQPLSYLHFDHEAVQTLGIDADTAKAIGIGYAKKGIMRGRVAIPIRQGNGTLVGYCGYCADADPPLKLPKVLHIS